MKSFELFCPDSLQSAAERAGAGTAFKAGGLDLIDRLKERVAAPETVIDLMPLRAKMSAIVVADDHVVVGALATLTQVAKAEALQPTAYRAVTTAAADAATPQIRNRATVGGNLLQMARCWYLRNARFACSHSGRGDTCLAQEGEHRYHAIMGTFDCIRVHPSNLAPPLLAMNAVIDVRGADGTMRQMPLHELYPAEPSAEEPEHTLAEGEILVSVRIPMPAAGSSSAYRESREQQAHDWATTAAAVRLQIKDGRIAAAAVCLGAVAPNPVVAATAAAQLVGQNPDRELFQKVAEVAFADADPLDQNAYKVPVGKAVLIDALIEAAETR